MRIGVYASCRDEEKNLDAWLASVADADVVAINDTGSTDHTMKMLQRRALRDGRLRISQHPVEPMQLSNALNIAMSQLPDIDLAIRLDLDERLQPGWRDQLEHQAVDGPTVFQPWFDHAGNIYRHDRIHTPGFRWELPVHEILTTDGPYERIPIEITIEHHQDLTKDRSQVLHELRAAHAADPTNLRLLHYLGREHTYRHNWQAAIPLLRAHAESDAYPEERSESWRLLGDCYTALMPPEEQSDRPYRMATTTCPERREGWVALANLHMKQNRWRDCLHNATRALSITEKSWYLNHPFAWSGQPHHLAALASWHLDQYENAAQHGRRAVELEPANELYRRNLEWYERALTNA